MPQFDPDSHNPVRAVTFGVWPALLTLLGRISESGGMLKITIAESKSGQTIKLEGKIVGPWVEELNRTWHSLTPSLGSKYLKFDLCNVAFVDDKGRQLLREIYQQTNARFLTDSPLTQYFADDAMRYSEKRRRRSLKCAVPMDSNQMKAASHAS